jgi:hypothetical protein
MHNYAYSLLSAGMSRRWFHAARGFAGKGCMAGACGPHGAVATVPVFRVLNCNHGRFLSKKKGAEAPFFITAQANQWRVSTWTNGSVD